MATAICVAVPAMADTPLEIISARQANYKRIGDIADSLKKSLEAGASAASLEPLAAELDMRAHRIHDFFPAGTETGGNTKARPEIWSNREGFNAAAMTLTDATTKLEALAKAGDNDGFAAQFRTTGAACGACHRNFRAR
jgi:cytochrome c556